MCKEEILCVTTSMERCPFCGSSLIIKYNRNPKPLITLSGEYIVLERVRKCSNKDCKGNSISFKSEDLQRITIPRRVFCLDVILYVGALRYEEHKTYDEIKEKLGEGEISISRGEVFNLCLCFESLIKGWHEERVGEIKKNLGEYILSVDGTYSYKGRTLYIFRDYISGVVLYAETTEKDDKPHIKPLFEKVIQRYGEPIAVISDMQDAFIASVKELLPATPHQYCQYHFLKNAGKYMEEDYKRLGDEMKKKSVEAKAKEIEGEFKKFAEKKKCSAT